MINWLDVMEPTSFLFLFIQKSQIVYLDVNQLISRKKMFLFVHNYSWSFKTITQLIAITIEINIVINHHCYNCYLGSKHFFLLCNLIPFNLWALNQQLIYIELNKNVCTTIAQHKQNCYYLSSIYWSQSYCVFLSQCNHCVSLCLCLKNLPRRCHHYHHIWHIAIGERGIQYNYIHWTEPWTIHSNGMWWTIVSQ